MTEAIKIDSNPAFKKLSQKKSSSNSYELAVYGLVDDMSIAEAIIKTEFEYISNLSSFDFGRQIEYIKKKGQDVMTIWGCYCFAYHENNGAWPSVRTEFAKRKGSYGGLRSREVLRFMRSFRHGGAYNEKELKNYFRWYFQNTPTPKFCWGLEVNKIRNWRKNMDYNYNELIELFKARYKVEYDVDCFISMTQMEADRMADKLIENINDSGTQSSDYLSWFFTVHQKTWNRIVGLSHFLSGAAWNGYLHDIKNSTESFSEIERQLKEMNAMNKKRNK